MKILFYLPDYEKIENYEKTIKYLYPGAHSEFINDRKIFLKKLESNILDLVFFNLSDTNQDISFFNRAYSLNSMIPTVLIVKSLDVVSKFFENIVKGKILEVTTEKDFLDSSLTSQYLKGIKKIWEKIKIKT